MSHNIRYYTYGEKVDKKKVESDLSAFVAAEDWQEGCCGLPQPIRWLNVICNSQEEAEKYIEKSDRHNYDCLAVKFQETSREFRKSKKYLDLLERQSKAWNKYKEEDSKIRLQDQKSAYVTCRRCGSKLNRLTLIQRLGAGANHCPVCRGDLRSDTVLKVIENARSRYIQLSAEIKEEEKKDSKKSKEIKWLVKIEYHT